MIERKLLFTGATGAGKTTAIAAISETKMVRTDVPNSDPTVSKALTTVGLDYGEITLDNGEKFRLFGTPGQQRFAFTWPILSRGAIGLIILIDNSAADPLADIVTYARGFQPLIESAACVVGVGRLETHVRPSLDDHSRTLASVGLLCPIIPVDVRQKADVLLLIDILLTQLENKR